MATTFGSIPSAGEAAVATAAELPEETILAYLRQGFVHIPGVLSREEAMTFRAAALDFAAHMAHQNRTRGGKAEQVFTQHVNVWQEDATLKQLTLRANLGAIAVRLAGIPLRLWHDHILIKQPQTSAPTEFHQDQPYWPHAHSRHALSAWIALQDVPVERGCMTFLPGSHALTGLRAQDLTDADDLFSVAPDLRWLPRVTIPLRAGDCTFHNSFCAHMATANVTDEPRVAHVVIFMDAETEYDPSSSSHHPVTAPLGLEGGQRLDGPSFPLIGQ